MTESERTDGRKPDSDSSPGSVARLAALQRWDRIQHPLHGLGLLEDALVQIASLTRNADICLDKKAVVVFCSDNGVTAEGVTQADSSVTGVVARLLVRGTAPVCRMADTAGADVIPVDMGIRDFTKTQGVLDRRIGNGTADILHGPAMTYEEAQRAISTGIDLAGELKRKGYRILAVGEMGIGNTTTASACASVLLRQDPVRMTGRGAGLSKQGYQHKVEVIREAIRINGLDWKKRRLPGEGHPDRAGDETAGEGADAALVLSRVGGFDLLGMCGMFLGGSIHRIPLLIDGFASSVAALAAVMICPDCADAMLASHLSSEPAGSLILEALGKEPLITGKLHLGEGTGAVLAMPMLDMALAVYRDAVTFEEGGVEAYRPL